MDEPNSLLVPWCTAALDLLVHGVSDLESIDRTWMITLQTGLGPCGMMDRMGLGVVHHVAKLGLGFYRYPDPAYAQPGFI